MPLGEQIQDDMRNLNDKFHEFNTHIKEDIDLSLFSFSEICTLGEYESRIFEYMTIKILFKGFQRNLFHIFVSLPFNF